MGGNAIVADEDGNLPPGVLVAERCRPPRRSSSLINKIETRNAQRRDRGNGTEFDTLQMNRFGFFSSFFKRFFAMTLSVCECVCVCVCVCVSGAGCCSDESPDGDHRSADVHAVRTLRHTQQRRHTFPSSELDIKNRKRKRRESSGDEKSALDPLFSGNSANYSLPICLWESLLNTATQNSSSICKPSR